MYNEKKGGKKGCNKTVLEDSSKYPVSYIMKLGSRFTKYPF